MTCPRHASSPILEYFVHHPDEVLAKQDILDHVWDFDFDGDPNIVEVYVRQTASQAAALEQPPGDRNRSRRRVPAGRRSCLERLATIRAGTTAAATIIVAIALVAGAMALVAARAVTT